ncbi:hypothetical protein KJ780_02065 [Candidatus Micrarchaeota archaeon]|nr:hypothetical protein [Candidatus Micrarchaeota archaeon]
MEDWLKPTDTGIEGNGSVKTKEPIVNVKEPIGIIPLIIAHSLLGAGIAIIGHRTKNKIEYYFGLLFIPIMIGIIVAGSGCNYYCVFYNSFSGNCSGCVYKIAYPLISLASWIYVVARLIYIAVKKENQLKIL